MNSARVAITTELELGNGMKFACFLTEDKQIDEGLKPYLERNGIAAFDYKPDVVGSQMFTVFCVSRQEREAVTRLIETYYISWGKKPSVRPISDIIS